MSKVAEAVIHCSNDSINYVAPNIKLEFHKLKIIMNENIFSSIAKASNYVNYILGI